MMIWMTKKLRLFQAVFNRENRASTLPAKRDYGSNECSLSGYIPSFTSFL
jgi:hypothetical protein